MNGPYRTAVVTGASSGMGRALSLWLARRGVQVFAVARRLPELEELAREAPGIEPVELDVCDTARTLRLLGELDARIGGADLVIANAGVGLVTNARRLSWENVERTIDVNVKAAAATLSAFVPNMVERRRGHLVGISSIAAWRALPKNAAYSASKAFLSAFLEGLGIDLRPVGVTVTAVHPGFVKTAFHEKANYQLPFILELDDAANRIGEAILRQKRVVAFPWQLAWPMRLGRLLPGWLYDAVTSKISYR